jgi:acyl-CoA thioester hydrolase
MRTKGISYRALEKSGLRLPVTELDIRYLAPARYEDLVRVRCWVRDVASRKVVFGYAVDLADNQQLLATAQTALIAVDSSHALSTIPRAIRQQLVPTQDPVRM